MKALPLLDEVVQELERDVNITRIKKLLLFICKKIWENDATKLELFLLRDLIEELYSQNNTLSKLQSTVNAKLEKINKKSDYILISEIILTQVKRLYEGQKNNDGVAPLFNSNNNNNNNNCDRLQLEVDILKEKPISQASSEDTKLPASYNLFDLRQKILQGTNPLLAKILIFSTLYHKFTFSDRDWSLLKKQELDELVRNLFHTCHTLTDLKSKLYRTAKALENSDKNLQAANVILKTLTPLYASLANNSNPPQLSKVMNQPENAEIGRSRPTHNDADDSSNDDSDVPYAQLIQSYPETAKIPDPKILSNESQKQVSRSPAPPPRQPETTENEQGARKFSLAALNISESIKQKREQEKKIKELVVKNVNIVMNVMENTLGELENDLETQLQREQPEDYLSLKYQALGDFIKNVQETSAKFREILTRLEEAERQRLNK